MSASIAELFVNLGIKGDDKTVGALKGVQGGLKDTASMGLEAKAAIVGAVYALEQLFAKSNKAGTDLVNFNSVVGVTADSLQRYQYAARQVGASNEEVSGTFKALQSDMSNILLGKGAPAGMRQFANTVGGVTSQDIQRFAQHPEMLLQKLQEYAGKEKNLWLKNEVLKSFGLSDAMIAALNRQAFRPEALAKAPVHSDNETKTLDRNKAIWSNLETKIEMGVGHLNAKFGGTLAADISKITDKVFALLSAFEHLAEKIQIFQKIGLVFEGWAKIFDGITAAVNALNSATGRQGAEESAKEGATDIFKYVKGEALGYGDLGEGAKPLAGASKLAVKGEEENVAREKEARQFFSSMVSFFSRFAGGEPRKEPVSVTKASGTAPLPTKPGTLTRDVSPRGEVPPAKLQLVPAPPVGPSPIAVATPNAPAGVTNNASNQNVNVNQTLNFNGDGASPKEASDAHKRAAQSVFRQLPSQAQGN